MSATQQWVTVLLSIAAWMVLSNHCALGLTDATGPDSSASSGGCPMHSAPAKNKPSASLPCCKDLSAVAFHAAKSVASAANQLLGVQNYIAALFLVPPRVAFRSVTLDPGPPGAPTFAESVLQRSLLAHAPPLLSAEL